MSTALPPSKRPTPPGRPPTSPGEAGVKRTFGATRTKQDIVHKVVIYGPGGVGKTKLASLIAAYGVPPLYIDLEDGAKYLDVDCVEPTVSTWQELRSVLHDTNLLSNFGAIVLDSGTKAEELCIEHTLETVMHEKGHKVNSVEGYGFGKGLTHVYETFLQLLSDLDGVARMGKHVIVIAHECVATVPNPQGEDWIRYEPRLQSPASGKSSIRHRIKEWCDHLIYVGYDTSVDKEGKAKGGGSRTIYPTERPTHWAKSRTLSSPIIYQDGDAELWKQLLKKG